MYCPKPSKSKEPSDMFDFERPIVCTKPFKPERPIKSFPCVFEEKPLKK